MKRLIFDLDNTLIIWNDKYINALKETIKKYKNIDGKELNDLTRNYNELIENYENYYNHYSIDNMVDLLNKIGANIDNEFIIDWLDRLGTMADYDNEVVNTLKYLGKKYELVVLTNWFRKPQIERLKTAEIYKYFKEVYDGETTIKPNIDGFKKACGDKKIEECIMIGDNYKIDIEPAINLGLKAILVDRNDKYPESDKYIKIKKIQELKEIL